MRAASSPAGWLVGIVILVVANSVSAQSPYGMQGTVTEIDTGKPVPKATVQVLIESEQVPEQRIRKGVTGPDGRYSIELPPGHAWTWTLIAPDGHSPDKPHDKEFFATTADRPSFTKDYQLRKGVAIPVSVRLADNTTPKSKTYVALSQQQKDAYFSEFRELDSRGMATITLPAATGKFTIGCGDEQRRLVAPEVMSIEFDDGFDPAQAQAPLAGQDDGTKIIRDASGRTARLQGCDAAIVEGKLMIVINATVVTVEEAQQHLRGRVVDARGQGIPGALVRLAFHSRGGSATSAITATTDAAGRFTLAVPKLRSGQRVALVVTRQGYAGRDTKPLELSMPGAADVGDVQLDEAASLRVRVVGPDGSPLHGAVVEPVNDYASRTRIARTGPDGECELTDLAAGLMSLSTRFGTLRASTRVPLKRGENEVVVLKLAAPRTPASAPPAEPQPALAVGTIAPEWDVAQWTDGADRKLSDYQGKVVVLDFWGVWCGPCLHAIAAMKELERRFKERDVVFLGIHTAGSDMTLINRLLKHEDWQLITGLDRGDEITAGATVRRYAVSGFPTVVIIDRNGRIAFNSGDRPKDGETFLREVQEVAEAAGLPWPLDKDATEEQVKERVTRLQIVRLSRRIEEALKIKAE